MTPDPPRPLLEALAIARHYPLSRAFGPVALVKAVDGATFSLAAGKTLAVVGESGSGKSTLARVVAMIEPATSGKLIIDNVDVAKASRDQLRKLRSEVQVVFQDPYGSLNPRLTVGKILAEPLAINRRDMPRAVRRDLTLAMMAEVGLRPEHYWRYPHMFSGGQRQRIAIARALMLKPAIVVLDEPVSALDVSVQAQVLNLLMDLQERHVLAYLFISHSLSVVRHIADAVMVMYLGRPVESGTRDVVFSNPRHPYTRALLAATPTADPTRRRERVMVRGEPPSPVNPPAGCAFHPRCPLAFARCRIERPELELKGNVHVACFAVDKDGVTRGPAATTAEVTG